MLPCMTLPMPDMKQALLPPVLACGMVCWEAGNSVHCGNGDYCRVPLRRQSIGHGLLTLCIGFGLVWAGISSPRYHRPCVRVHSPPLPFPAALHSPSHRISPLQQDLGSQRAAEQYAADLPLGLQHVSFSTAGLSRVPPLQRLLYLESLALSYNHLVDVGSEALAGLSANLKVRGGGKGETEIVLGLGVQDGGWCLHSHSLLLKVVCDTAVCFPLGGADTEELTPPDAALIPFTDVDLGLRGPVFPASRLRRTAAGPHRAQPQQVSWRTQLTGASFIFCVGPFHWPIAETRAPSLPTSPCTLKTVSLQTLVTRCPLFHLPARHPQ